ncbi:MAG: hypothetical protein Q8R02_19865 [Hyphomonadaceae bacterium]|nr:hypothetical protein [Hyphomonadaceae bacterium]
MKLSHSLAIGLASAALGLAACSPSAPATDAASTPAAADSTTAAANMPAELKEGPAAGKWRVTMTAMGTAMPPTETCYAKQVSFEESQQMQQQAGVSCSEQTYTREGDAFVGHSVCTMEVAGKTMTTTSDMRVTGDFNTKYTMDMTNKMDPPPMPGMEEQKMTIEMERLGDC